MNISLSFKKLFDTSYASGLFSLVIAGLLLSASSLANQVRVLTLHDTINPGTADYILSEIKNAEQSGDAYVIIELDTAGGLLTSTRSIVQAMLNSPVPIVVYVTPQGAHATSAGSLITMAADVAAMSPGTHIGAAHPVVPGAQPEKASTMDEKMTNATVSFAESIAKARGRNVEWAKQSVKDSASIIAKEALSKNVVDLIAPNRAELIEKLKGYPLKVAKAQVQSLPSQTLTLLEVPMNLKQRLVSFLAHPQIAYLIMSLGGLCVWVELTHPGLIFPGVLGVLCIVLSLISFQLLPISYGALALIVVGLILMVSEAFFTSYGVLAIGGVVSFVLGSLFLVEGVSSEFQIGLSMILPTAAFLLSACLGLTYLLLKSRKRKVQLGLTGLIGETGQAQSAIDATSGSVFVQGELWRARSQGEEIVAGTVVEVLALEGMTLTVRAQPC